MSQKIPLNIVKIGGNVIDDSNKLQQFLKDFSALPEKKILVHGGGKIATKFASQMGIEAVMIDGRRVTDPEMLKIVTMVYGGLVNKNIVSQLQALGTNAIGLGGMDGQIILSKKREPNPIDFGLVGDIVAVQHTTIQKLLDAELSPVLAPLTSDKEGQILNTNADTIAQSIAVALANNFEVKLTYCFEKKGVLADPENEESVIAHINKDSYKNYKETGVISGGMIPKLDNAFQALNDGVNTVRICSSEELNSNSGTIIQ